MAAEKYFNFHTVIIMQFTSDEWMTFLNLTLTLEHYVKTLFVLISFDKIELVFYWFPIVTWLVIGRSLVERTRCLPIKSKQTHCWSILKFWKLRTIDLHCEHGGNGKISILGIWNLLHFTEKVNISLMVLVQNFGENMARKAKTAVSKFY